MIHTLHPRTRVGPRWHAAFLIGLSACGEPVVEPPPAPSVPQITPLAVIPIPPQYGVHDTFVRDGIALVCAWNTGLIIYDVGDGRQGGSPSSPVEISRIVTNADGVPGGPAVHNAWWFYNPVSGEHRYVFVGQEGPAAIPVSSSGDIHVVDVSDLTQPQEVAFYHMDVSPSAGTHNFWMDEPAQILYAAYYNGGVVALDVSGTLSGDLAAREIARIKPASSPFVWGVQLSGGSLYATDMLSGLFQIQLTGNAFTVVSGGGNVPDRYTSDLWVYGDHAYTGTWGGQPRNGVAGNALKIWQLSGAGVPLLADSVILEGVATVGDVKASEDGKLLALSADRGGKAGLYMFGLLDPTKPELVAQALIPGGVHTARIADIGGKRYVFAAKNPGPESTPQLLIYDVTALVP